MDFVSLLLVLIVMGLPAGAAIALVQSLEKRRKAKESKQLQKDEQARALKAQRQAEEKTRLEEAARLQEERTKREEKQTEQELQALSNTNTGARRGTSGGLLGGEEKRGELEGELRSRAEERIHELAEIVRTAFLVKNCSRCHENKMALIEVSPNAKSIEYACTYCRRRQRAQANSLDVQRVKSLERFVVAVLGTTWFKTVKDGYRCTFSVPEATLPYERPGRELIPDAIRGQVWRRDNGRCVQCRSKQNLQFDHIIPVAEGGATTIDNLQLLCQSCNLSKGAKI